MPKSNIRPEDKTIGSNVRRIRMHKKMSQSELAASMQLTFQQVQKYEKGTNRISGSRLVHISRALEVPLEALFAGIDRKNGVVYHDPTHVFAEIPGASRLIETINAMDIATREKVVATLRVVAKAFE